MQLFFINTRTDTACDIFITQTQTPPSINQSPLLLIPARIISRSSACKLIYQLDSIITDRTSRIGEDCRFGLAILQQNALHIGYVSYMVVLTARTLAVTHGRSQVRSVSGDGAAYMPHRTHSGDVGAPRGGAARIERSRLTGKQCQPRAGIRRTRYSCIRVFRDLIHALRRNADTSLN
jgi:hypothetical protein